MDFRSHGSAPYRVAVLHGGPGAPGEMRPVAAALSQRGGVLEPFQTACSVTGQVEELAQQLRQHAEPPVILIGYSWGAMLGLLFTAAHPELVRKFILVSSGVFDAEAANQILPTRLSRLSAEKRARFDEVQAALQDPNAPGKDLLFSEFGAILTSADHYDPLPHENEVIATEHRVFDPVWNEAAEMRRAGRFIELAGQITCPVVAIHGDYDPHPATGIREPLQAAIRDFKWILLDRCGHTPWYEKQAAAAFYATLERETWGETE